MDLRFLGGRHGSSWVKVGETQKPLEQTGSSCSLAAPVAEKMVVEEATHPPGHSEARTSGHLGSQVRWGPTAVGRAVPPMPPCPALGTSAVAVTGKTPFFIRCFSGIGKCGGLPDNSIGGLTSSQTMFYGNKSNLEAL